MREFLTSSPQLALGYDRFSQDLSHPYDRRRAAWWARVRGISLDSATPTGNGLVFLHSHSDLPYWVKQKAKYPELKLAVDLVDSYLMAKPNPVEDCGRSLVRIANRDFSPSLGSYTSWLERAVRVADVVICSTPEQAEFLRELNGNVHPILDWHGELPRLEAHDRETSSDRVSIFWEGQSATLKHLVDLAGPLRETSRRVPLQLNVVTDARVPIVGPQTLGRSSQRLLDKTFSGSDVTVVFRPWTTENVQRAAALSDFAVLPISRDDPFARAKPENRLLIAWRLGLPCLTSDTPAYSRVMQDAGVSALCGSADDWEASLTRYCNENDTRLGNLIKGQAYLAKQHSDEQLLSRWDQALIRLIS